MANDIPTSLNDKEQPKSTAKVTVHGSIANKMKIGEPAAMRMKGAVKSINPTYNHADHYDVEIEDPHIEHIDNDGDDDDLATMPKEKLKKKITKTDDSGGYYDPGY